MRRILVMVMLCSVLSNCQKVIHPGDGTPPNPSADATLVSDWVSLHLRLIRNTRGVQHIVYSRHFACAGIALYEAVAPAGTPYRSLGGQLNGLTSLPAAPDGKKLHAEASANAALAQVMRSFYGSNPAHAALIDSLETVLRDSFRPVGNVDRRTESAAYGKAVAAAVVAWANTDGSDQADAPYTPPPGPGRWQPTPPSQTRASLPYWSNNRPIVAGSGQGATLPAPVAYSTDPGSPFYAMVNQVYQTSKQLTPEQRLVALFWDDAPNGKYVSAFGHWISVLAQVTKARKYSLAETAEAYATTAIAMHEAIIAAWKLKYTHNLVRPVTYIQQHIEGGWLPLIVTPAHPEYPAAHATLSAAAAYALTQTLGSNVSFTDRTYEDIGLAARSFASFEAAGAEAGISRLYGGIHYAPSIDAGASVGKQVAQNVTNALGFKE
ncbi:MAG TPA: vanadium-dependent haloperoxidase [Cytophagales bacterium]|jgi:membrane-associated phospholipid phosphatase